MIKDLACNQNTLSNTSFAIIFMGKRVLVASLCISSWCLALLRGAMGLSAVYDCGIS